MTRPHSIPPRHVSSLALLALVLIWGANFSVVKFALRELSPLAFNGLRFVISSACLAAFLGVSGERPRIERRHWPAVIGLGVVGTTVYQILFILGIDRTFAGNASLMLAATPIFTTLFSVASHQERISPSVAAGVLLSVAGIALVVLGGTAGVSFTAGSVAGDLMVLAASIAWSVYTVGSAPLVQRYGVLPVTATTMWAGTLGLLAASLPAFLRQDWPAVSPVSWAALLYSGSFGIAIAYFLWYQCVRQIGTTRTAVYANFVPVVALVIAWLALGEAPTLLQVIGAGGILAGTLIVRAGKIERPGPAR